LRVAAETRACPAGAAASIRDATLVVSPIAE
jgi:hypothetical protein